MEDNSTTSGLLWEVERILLEAAIKPKVLIMENVVQVHSAKNIKAFNRWKTSLKNMGYTNFAADINSKNYGSSQSRNRCYMVSFLDLKGTFKFPEPKEIKNYFEDIEEPIVDQKYYLTNKQIRGILSWKAYQKPFKKVLGAKSILPTITARGAGNLHSGMVIYSNKFKETINLYERFKNTDAINENLGIRYITPRETFRAMGFSDKNFDDVKDNQTNNSLYHLAGDSIVVDVAQAILEEVLETLKGEE